MIRVQVTACTFLMENMLKSCTYCGKIHDGKFICREKEEALKKRQGKNKTKENQFRWSRKWKKKAEEIKARDRYLCQVCIRELYGTERKYNPHDLSVHHIVKLKDDYGRRMDNANLITMCRRHHEEAERGDIPAALLREITTEQEGGSH